MVSATITKSVRGSNCAGEQLREYLSPVSEMFGHMTDRLLSQATEFRFRAGRNACAELPGERVTLKGVVTPELLQSLLEKFCDYSLYSFENCIADGFITLRGGHRAGLAGTAVYGENGQISSLRDISSINLRVAREFFGCGGNIHKVLQKDGFTGVIIAGKPMSAKTTVLRDLCRIISRNHKITVADERGEIAAVYGGTPALDVGENTDILTGFCKADSFTRAIRTLSPEFVACDETDLNDDRLLDCAGRGVKLLLTCHTDETVTKETLLSHPVISKFKHSVSHVITLKNLGELGEVYRTADLCKAS